MELLFADAECAAFHKPSGLLVHRSPIDRHETRFALQIARDRLGRRVYPVHRLDKPTSGILLFALSPESAREISAAFAAGRVEKSYLAIVRGCPAAEGTIDHPLVEEPEGVEGGAAEERLPRPALTTFRRLASAELPEAVGRYPTSRYSLVEALPRTGRRHQIRRHFKHIFHPLVGDTKYGDGRHNRFFRERYGCSRLLLAAVGLTFPHPGGGRITVAAPPEESFLSVVERLGWSEALPEGIRGI